MNLYNITLQKPTAITHAIVGNFSGNKSQNTKNLIQEMVICRGKYLELWKQDENTQKFQCIVSSEVIGLVRSITSFRFTGSLKKINFLGFSKDFLVVGSDSGRIVILEYEGKRKEFIKLHQETYGKTGCRRIVPGQYLSVDPKGRAIMIGAIEKQKFVYVLNRDSSNKLTISSPLEAHSSNTIVYSMVGVDVDFENPLFACLEVNYNDSPKKMVTFYELDLGLNNVVKKSSKEVDGTSHLLIGVPGSQDGPSGIIICSENLLTYRSLQGKDISIPIPRRYRKDGDYSRGMMITSHFYLKKKGIFHLMLQNEDGDLLKVDFEIKNNQVQKLNIGYFDTIPVGISFCVFRNGYLFLASEFSNHRIYAFKGFDEKDNISSYTEIGKLLIPLFNVHSLKNLQMKEEIESLSPVIDFKAVDLMQEGIPQLYTLCGRGNRSSLRILKHGLPISEFAVTEFKSTPNFVWTVKKSHNETYDSYLVVSFSNHTMVLSIGDAVEQINDSGFLANVPTIGVSLLKDSLLQIHPNALRQIQGTGKKIIDWESKRLITKCAVNESQVVISTSGGELLYFETNENGILVLVDKKEMGQDVACLAIGRVPQGKKRSRFVAVGFYDKTVKIISLDPDDIFQILTRQALPSEPESLAIIEIETETSIDHEQIDSNLHLFVGLNNGILYKSIMDKQSGELSDTRSRLLGSKPVKLTCTKVNGSNSILALSNRSWLCYNHQSKFQITPLSYDVLQFATSFSSKQCHEGLVAVSGPSLRVFSIEKLGEVFNQTTIPLDYTPRRMGIHPVTQKIVIIQSDHNSFNKTELQKIHDKEIDDMDTDNKQKEEKDLSLNDYGITYKPSSNSGKWASYIQIIDPIKKRIISTVEIGENEACFSMAICNFSKEYYLVVGTGKNVNLYPRKNDGGFLHVYKFTQDSKLEFIHKTEMEDIPTSLCSFGDRVLVGMGKFLRIYELGKKKLLKKSENKNFPNVITTVSHMGARVYVGDVMESFQFVKYKKEEQTLNIFADNTTPRWVTSQAIIDYNTLAGGDKFGNIFLVRVPHDVQDTFEEDPNSNKWMWERNVFGGSSQKSREIISFHIGETVTSLTRTNFVPGSNGIILYMTVMGTIGCLIPFSVKEDVDFFSLLEMSLRQEQTSLVGRDHLSFVSYYYPVKGVIDGDLLESFEKLSLDKQKSISDELEKTPNEIKKKLEDLKSQSGF